MHTSSPEGWELQESSQNIKARATHILNSSSKHQCMCLSIMPSHSGKVCKTSSIGASEMAYVHWVKGWAWLHSLRDLSTWVHGYELQVLPLRYTFGNLWNSFYKMDMWLLTKEHRISVPTVIATSLEYLGRNFCLPIFLCQSFIRVRFLSFFSCEVCTIYNHGICYFTRFSVMITFDPLSLVEFQVMAHAFSQQSKIDSPFFYFAAYLSREEELYVSLCVCSCGAYTRTLMSVRMPTLAYTFIDIHT